MSDTISGPAFRPMNPAAPGGLPRPLGNASTRIDAPSSPIRRRAGDDAPAEVPPARLGAIALVAALAGHAAILASMSIGLRTVAPAEAPDAMAVSLVVIPGDPPPGDPRGKDSPPPAAKTDEGQPSATTTTTEQAVVAPNPPQPDAPALPVVPKYAGDQPPTKSTGVGVGSLALGARTSGDATGLDAGLMASVGQAVATRVRTCWSPPKDAPRDVATRISVSYKPDGTIDGDPVALDGSEPPKPVATPSEAQIQGVDAVKRCAPIGLPAFLYPYWRNVEIQIYSTN